MYIKVTGRHGFFRRPEHTGKGRYIDKDIKGEKMKKQAFFKKAAAAGMAAVMLATSVSAASAGSAAEPAMEESGVSVAEEAVSAETPEETAENLLSSVPDIRMSIRREPQLMEEASLSIDEWDAELSEMKKEGLAQALTEDVILSSDPDTKILKENDTVYFIGESDAFSPVTNAQEACRTAYSLIDLMGGSEETDLRIWSELDINGLTVYSFQQVADSEAVSGSTMKIAADENGVISGIFNSLTEDMGAASSAVTRAQAEQAVLDYMEEQGTPAEIIAGKTGRAIHSVDTLADLDVDNEEITHPQLLWIVYTANTGEEQAERPYLAHYVRLDGGYLYSLPVKEPGDTESLDGYRKQPVFDGMEAGSWSGDVMDFRGRLHHITVPVMHSEETGLWYLGDTDRRIAVADYAEAAYGDTHSIQLISSEDNSGWDTEDLLMFHNYICAWDYYAKLGWIGPDGQGTDVIILKGLCTKDGTPYENACSMGKIENWQMFGYCPYDAAGTPVGLSQGLDVMAHEYTHTFTSTVMNENLYENDLGAINEAMSDIFGNIIEYSYDATDDETWRLGENTPMTVRSMSDPHAFQQPEYVWDLYYGPHAATVTAANDRGGVHFNSSLLNRIAALLCLDHGMPLDDAAAFWFTTAFGLTPKTDYLQMGNLLDWAAQVSGAGAYDEAVNALVEEEQLGRTEVPEELPEGRFLATLQLPDTEAMNDENWALITLQLDTESLSRLGEAVIDIIMQMIDDPEDMAKFGEIFTELVDDLHLDGKSLRLDRINENTTDDDMVEVLTDVFVDASRTVITQNLSWEENDSGTIPVMLRDIPTVYALLNVTEAGTKINGMAVLIGDRWIDFGSVINSVGEIQKEDADSLREETMDALKDKLADIAIEIITARLERFSEKVDNFLSGTPDSGAESVETEGKGRFIQLPADGLAEIEFIKD